MEPQHYLKRIGYTGALQPDAATLRGLQVAHLYAVPFENLDIHLSRQIGLELPALYDKIVVRRRGGFCYELNGLFAWLLQELGFHVTYLSASDAHEDGSFGPDFDHLTLLVTCPADPDPQVAWLADVGWGDTFVAPLRAGVKDEQIQGLRTYWLECQEVRYILWQRDVDGYTERQYCFTHQPRRFEEFAAMCLYHQTSPESLFTRKRLCTMATPTGRLTLSGDRFIVTQDGERKERIVGEEEWNALLAAHFGLRLP